MLLASWRRHLVAENKSPSTFQTYMEALTLFGRFLVERGMPTDPVDIAREHVEEFIADLLGRFKPATAANRYRALGTFFRWLVEEGEIAVSPMAKMRPLTVNEVMVRSGYAALYTYLPGCEVRRADPRGTKLCAGA